MHVAWFTSVIPGKVIVIMPGQVIVLWYTAPKTDRALVTELSKSLFRLRFPAQTRLTMFRHGSGAAQAAHAIPHLAYLLARPRFWIPYLIIYLGCVCNRLYRCLCF
jgi:hypothetical protein